MKKNFLVLIALLCFSSLYAQDDDKKKIGGGHGLGSQGVTSGAKGGGHGLGSQGRSQGAISGVFSLNGGDIPRSPRPSANAYNRANSSKIAVGNKASVVKDSAYYQNFVKRNGWFEGRGPKLTEEEASHLSCYYKFSKKNSAGHWTFIQAYDGYGNLTTYHDIASYILNQFDGTDINANKAWKEKMSSVCQWEFVGSNDGKTVIQEIALDSYGNVVYSAIPTKIGTNTFLYSYIDSWGRPAYPRTDSLGNDIGFANFVEVTRNDKGYEVLYKYTDRNGIPAPNRSGEYMNRREYNENGDLLSHASLNVLGVRMIDEFGNCGQSATYDSRGNILTNMNYNDEGVYGKPMILYYNARNKTMDETCGNWYKYDKYGREIERGFLDTLGNRCSNQYGAFRIIREYNAHGLQTHCIAYDFNGNKAAMDSLGISEYVNTIDDNGYFLSTQTYDANGKLVNNEEGVCKKTWSFDADIETEETEYQVFADTISVKFHFERDSEGNEIRMWPNDDMIRIDSVNNRKDEILIAYYTMDKLPKDCWGFHKRVSTYKYEKGKRVLRQEWFDKEGKPADEEYSNGSTNGYTSQVLISDTINHCEYKYQYYYNYLKQAFVQVYDDNMSSVQSQYDLTPIGEHARVGWWDALFYNAKVEFDYNSKLKSFIVENEFGEPAYLSSTDDDLIYHYQVSNNHGGYVKFDENGNEIPDSMMNDFRNRLPAAFCIEATDSLLASSYGFKNNDIIISFGNWITDADLRTNVNNFYLESIIQSSQNKDVIILRHHPQEKRSEIVKMSLPFGKLSDFGIYAHKIYYTQKEKARLLNTCKANGITLIHNENNVNENGKTILMAVQTKGSLFSSTFYHLPAYDLKDPAILLHATEKYRKGRDTWNVKRDSIEKWIVKDMYNPNFDGKSELYLTHNLKEIKVIRKEGKGNKGLHIIPLNVDNTLFAKVIQCCDNNKEIPNETDSIINLYSMAIIHVEDSGAFRDNNYEGYYILLQFNNWRLGQDLDSLGKEIENSRNLEHSMAFIKLNTDEEDFSLGEFFNVTFPPGYLGLRFQDYEFQDEIYQEALKQLGKIKKYKRK